MAKSCKSAPKKSAPKKAPAKGQGPGKAVADKFVNDSWKRS